MTTATAGIDTQKWIDAMTQSIGEVSRDLLGFGESAVIRTTTKIPSDMRGAHIAVVSLRDSLQIGLTAENEDCLKLAGALLGMEPDAGIPQGDVADAVGEIINVVAGGMKRRLIEHDPNLSIGLPIFFQGHLKAPANIDSLLVEVSLGSVPAKFFMIRNQK